MRRVTNEDGEYFHYIIHYHMRLKILQEDLDKLSQIRSEICVIEAIKERI